MRKGRPSCTALHGSHPSDNDSTVPPCLQQWAPGGCSWGAVFWYLGPSQYATPAPQNCPTNWSPTPPPSTCQGTSSRPGGWRETSIHTPRGKEPSLGARVGSGQQIQTPPPQKKTLDLDCSLRNWTRYAATPTMPQPLPLPCCCHVV